MKDFLFFNRENHIEQEETSRKEGQFEQELSAKNPPLLYKTAYENELNIGVDELYTTVCNPPSCDENQISEGFIMTTYNPYPEVSHP